MYDEAYFAERDRLPSHIALAVTDLLDECDAHTVLEVGVGTGQLMKFLRRNGYSVVGIDRSPLAAGIAGGIVGTATAIPFIGSKFDSVVAVSLIEHLDVNEGHLFIEEAFRVLRPGGVIFLVTPNFRSPLRYVQGDHWFGFSDKTHVTFYTPNHMRRLLAAHGFDGVRFAFRVNTAELEWPLPRFFYRLPARIRLFLNYVLASTPLGQFRDSFWVAARKPL